MAGRSLKLCGLRPSSSNNATKLQNITSDMRVLSYLAVATMQHPRNSAVLYVALFLFFFISLAFQVNTYVVATT